jgi:hypothetical protein
MRGWTHFVIRHRRKILLTWLLVFVLGAAGAANLGDATIVRALLVPAAMKLLGRWNWYLPERMRRVMRLSPSTTPFMTGAEAGTR